VTVALILTQAVTRTCIRTQSLFFALLLHNSNHDGANLLAQLFILAVNYPTLKDFADHLPIETELVVEATVGKVLLIFALLISL